MTVQADKGPGPMTGWLDRLRNALARLGDPQQYFRAARERRFARRITDDLLRCYAAVRAERPAIDAAVLYREALLRSGYVAEHQLDELIAQADDSVDEWTAPGRDGLGFRELVHFLIMQRFLASGQAGSVVSFADIVSTRIPADL